MSSKENKSIMTNRLLCGVMDTIEIPKRGTVIIPDRPIPLLIHFDIFVAPVTIKYPDGKQAVYKISFLWGFDVPDFFILIPHTEKREIPLGSELWVGEETYNFLQNDM